MARPLRGKEADTCQRGAATLLVTAMCGLLLLVGLAAVAVAGAFVAARRAQSAADLAALAAASALRTGADGCHVAAMVAEANHARLDRCRVRGSDVSVEVSLPGPRLAGRQPRLVGRARAGPA